MADPTQRGTGSLTLHGCKTRAAVYMPFGTGGALAAAIVTECVEKPGGQVQDEDKFDGEGKFHTNITYESGMHEATITFEGVVTSLQNNDLTGPHGGVQCYQVRDIQRSGGRSTVQYTVTVRKLPTITA